MNSRSSSNPFISSTRAIQQEIMRFESVHPSIYSLYDLADTIPNLLLQQQIREHIVNIEDSFVNSQEWTLSRSVVDLKLGVLGSINSGKSALVHRYLTGAYVQEESPEGGRFKKEVVIDSQSYLLLIRDEAGLPELQFTQWVDAVIFVFSLENERSFAAIYSYYAKMAHYHTNLQDIPIILVGTQDAISESNPRLIEDSRARKLANDLRRCAYYETCATYGLNVERVFQDACLKILQSRMAVSAPVGIRSSTPNNMIAMRPYYPPQPPAPPIVMKSYDTQSQASSGSGGGPSLTPTQSGGLHHHRVMMIDEGGRQRSFRQSPANVIPPEPPPRRPMRSINDSPSAQVMSLQPDSQMVDPFNSGPLLASTPLLSRKFSMTSSDEVVRVLRKSSSFSKVDDEKNLKSKNGDAGLELGVGRVIPLKQGFLYKKSSKPLNRDWKKKYVTLLDDGRLTYHPSLNDYMGNVKGKEINLLRTTVKIPGRGPRGSEIPKTNPQFNGKPGSVFGGGTELVKIGTPPDSSVIANSSMGPDTSASLSMNGLSAAGSNSKSDLPNIKKRQKRGDGDSFEFMVVSLDNIIWHFDSQSLEERDEWVEAIQQQIMTSLQQNSSDKPKTNAADRVVIQEIRSVPGNSVCADCNAPDPSWASLNLGILVCIECSGIHRNLGTHLSRIRSLDLDDWPPDLINIMTSIGNDLANSIWESNTKGQLKPRSASSREEKEKWVQSKYKLKEFLPPLPFSNVPFTQQLIDAVARQLVERTILVLAYCSPEHVSAPYSKTDTRTALHIASALANPILIQLLIWYGANVKLFDHEGHNCLYYARSAGSNDCIEILLANGCPDNPTLPRRRKPDAASSDAFNKLPSSNI